MATAINLFSPSVVAVGVAYNLLNPIRHTLRNWDDIETSAIVLSFRTIQRQRIEALQGELVQFLETARLSSDLASSSGAAKGAFDEKAQAHFNERVDFLLHTYGMIHDCLSRRVAGTQRSLTHCPSTRSERNTRL